MGFGDRTRLLQNLPSGSREKGGLYLISVGIDVAKRTHEACFMDAEGEEMGRPLRFPNTAGGVATLRALHQSVWIRLRILSRKLLSFR